MKSEMQILRLYFVGQKYVSFWDVHNPPFNNVKVFEEHWSSDNFFQESFKVKESNLHEIQNADTAF